MARELLLDVVHIRAIRVGGSIKALDLGRGESTARRACVVVGASCANAREGSGDNIKICIASGMHIEHTHE